MKVSCVLIAMFLAECAGGGVADRVPLGAAKPFFQSIRKADDIRVYEGLPHQTFENGLLRTESMRPDITLIAGYHFYTPATLGVERDVFRNVLSSRSTFRVFSGEKFCGGFHPDYCVTWTVRGMRYNALVCFGCHEIVLEGEGRTLRYDLSEQGYGALKKLLIRYAFKRPTREQG
jgi:hypothetical protein